MDNPFVAFGLLLGVILLVYGAILACVLIYERRTRPRHHDHPIPATPRSGAR